MKEGRKRGREEGGGGWRSCRKVGEGNGEGGEGMGGCGRVKEGGSNER